MPGGVLQGVVHGTLTPSQMACSSSRKRGRGDGASAWSDIPPDVLYNILRRLTVGDLVRCGAVCVSWRSAMLQCRPILEPPWVIPFWNGGTRGVVCPPERRLRRVSSMPWEMMRSSEYLGSSNGWIGLQHMESVHILHALSGDVLRLPDLTTIPGVETVPDCDGTGRWRGLAFPIRGKVCGYTGRGRYALKPNGAPFFDGIFVLSPPVDGDRDQLFVFALCSHMWRLLFARPGDVSWSLVDMPAPVGNFIIDITGYRGSVYAVDHSGRVVAWDYRCGSKGTAGADAAALASARPRFTRIVIWSGPPLSALLVQRYLVEEADVDGGLLQVEREVDANAEGLYKTVGVRVFRLDQLGGEGEGQERVWWRRLRHLGHSGIAIFLGRGISATFTCSDFPWLRRNCIYFAEGVYNLRTREMRASPVHYRWFHGDWLVPTLRSPAAGPPPKA